MPLLALGSKYTYLEFPHTWYSPKMCLLRACSHASNMLPLSFPYAVICFKKLYKLSVKSFLYISFYLFQLIYWINLESQKENSVASDPVIQQAARGRTSYCYIPTFHWTTELFPTLSGCKNVDCYDLTSCHSAPAPHLHFGMILAVNFSQTSSVKK